MSDADRTHERTPLPDAEADAYRARREALHAAVTDLERFLDDRDADTLEPDELEAALQDFHGALRRHVAEADAPDGLLASIIVTAPWLRSRARKLHDEHDRLLSEAANLIERARTGEADHGLLDDVRALSARVSDHRHRGTSLVLDAYMLDIPAGD